MEAFADLFRRLPPLRPSRGRRRGRGPPPPIRIRCSPGPGSPGGPRRGSASRPSPSPLRRAGTTAVSGEASPGGKCSFSTWVPSLELVGLVSPWPKPIVPWWTRLPSARTTRPAVTRTMIGRERRSTRLATRLPAARRPARRVAAARGPEGALAEHREQGGEEGEGGADHHRDADRQDRPEPVGRLQVGDEQHQHRGDHGAAGGGDRGDGLAQGQRQRLGRGRAALAALRGSGGRAAASSRSRRRTRAPASRKVPSVLTTIQPALISR